MTKALSSERWSPSAAGRSSGQAGHRSPSELQIDCPGCGARYRLPAQRLPASGWVQCSRCQHRWSLAATQLWPSAEVNEPSRTRSSEAAKPTPLRQSPTAGQREIDRILAELADNPRVGAPAWAAGPKARAWRGSPRSYLLLFCLILVLASLLLVGWATVTRPGLLDRLARLPLLREAPDPLGADNPAVPARRDTLSSVQQGAGDGAPAPGEPMTLPAADRSRPPQLPIVGQTFRLVAAEDGGQTLTLAGRVINNTGESQPLGAMIAEVRSEDGRSVDRWRLPLGQTQLAPGDVVDFSDRHNLTADGRLQVRLGWAADFAAESLALRDLTTTSENSTENVTNIAR